MEQQVTYVYALPPYIPVDENYRTVYATVDSLFSELFNFHVLEPVSKIKEIVKIQPAKRPKVLSTYLDTSKWLEKFERNASRREKQIDPKSFNCGNYMTKQRKYKTIPLKSENIEKYRYHKGDYMPLKTHKVRTRREIYMKIFSQSMDMKKFK